MLDFLLEKFSCLPSHSLFANPILFSSPHLFPLSCFMYRFSVRRQHHTVCLRCNVRSLTQAHGSLIGDFPLVQDKLCGPQSQYLEVE